MLRKSLGCLTALAFIGVYIAVVAPLCPAEAETKAIWIGIAIMMIIFLVVGRKRRKPVSGPSDYRRDYPATERQLAYIARLGGEPRDDMTMDEASDLIDRLLLEKRKDENRKVVEHQVKLRRIKK